MENTIKNIKMTNPIRGLVSKRRKRYMQDGFNLDLTYIGDRIIAMGFPAEKLEAMYRNRSDEVVKFLEMKHQDSYKIYNLCSERSYDLSKFKRAATYPFDDHNPPNIELIEAFCKDVHQWLCENKKNVAAVHCKAGKGRTGTMICCYMLYSRQFETASEALNYYGQQRTHDKKGVTIPSQRRYVEYYSQLLKSQKPYDRNVSLQIIEMKMKPPPSFPNHQGPIIFSISDIEGRKLHCAEFKNKSQDGYILIRLDCCVPLKGDAKVEFSCKNMMRKEKLFHFWLNTYFVNENALVVSDGFLNVTLNKSELDDAHKDKQSKVYPSDFKLEILLQKIPSKRYSDPVNRHSTPARILSCGNNNRHSDGGQQTNNHHMNNHNNMYNNHNHHLNNHLPHINSQPNHMPMHPPPLQHSQSLTTTTCDANTPSDSSENEASSSESSTEEEGWESGELLALVPQYYPKSDNYYYGSCTSSSSFNNNNKNNLNDTSNNISNNSNSITKTTNAVIASSKNLETGDTTKTNQNSIESNESIPSVSNNLNQLTTTSSNCNNGKIIINSQLTTLSPSLSSPTSSSSSPSQRAKTKQFKMKSNNIKSSLSSTNPQYGSSPTAGSHPLKIMGAKSKVNKLRWLKNMRSDPNLKETLTKSVKIRPSNAIPITTVSPVAKTKSAPSNDNLLSIDYYSSLCDKQLSFESPGRSPGSHMKKLLQKTLEGEIGGEDSEGHGTTTSIVVAKQIEVSSDKIGFNVKPSTSQRPVEIMPDSKNQKNNISVVGALPGENRFCNRFLSHFTNSKKQDSPNDQNANDSNVTPSCLSPAAVPRINRCTPFSFREIRLELQSVMKSQNQKSPQQNNNTH